MAPRRRGSWAEILAAGYVRFSGQSGWRVHPNGNFLRAADALAYKFGYRGPDPLAAYAVDARKFSLLDAGLLNQRSCRLLLINGMEDSIFPIEDNFIVARRGVNKDLLASGNRSHMGNPGGGDILYAWLDEVPAGMP